MIDVANLTDFPRLADQIADQKTLSNEKADLLILRKSADSNGWRRGWDLNPRTGD